MSEAHRLPRQVAPPPRGVLAGLVGVAVLGLAGCARGTEPLDPAALGEALAGSDEVLLEAGPGAVNDSIRALDAACSAPGERAELVVDYPLEESLFPPGFVPPRFLWHDGGKADAWLVRIAFADGELRLAVVPGGPPEQGWIDLRAQGTTNEVYELTEEQASAESWTPSEPLWDEIQARSVEAPVTVSFHGFRAAQPGTILSGGQVTFSTSTDEVGAPIFYRDVPLMPAVSEENGVIKPLSDKAVPIIEWRLKDVTRPDSKVVLTGMSTCANCHSFALDGKTMGMDVDGPTGDKGAYGIAPVGKKMVLGGDQVITWNSFADKPAGHKTIGFLSRISPDGRFALTTLNERLYVSNFANYKFLQVFFPVGGILAWYSTDTGEMKALPGADDPEFVHCNGVWTPDGKTIVFSRAKAFESPEWEAARYPNDPLEPQIRYDLYRMPFANGRGGTPELIEGGSGNGMSNTFPKVSPDGKWIVFTRCKNGQLLRPDGKLCIIPAAGGEARVMRCNTDLMNSWHSFSPNGRWMIFSSKTNTPYTQMFLTHIDEDGNDTPAILVPNATAANRAVNLPEFLNAAYEALEEIAVPATGHEPAQAYFEQAVSLMENLTFEQAVPLLERALESDPEMLQARVNLAFALRQSGQRTRAIEEYTRAIEINPADSLAQGALGLLRLDAAFRGVDLEREQAALVADPADLEARHRLGVALALDSKSDEAFGHLDRVLAKRPGDHDTMRSVAFARLAVGDVRQALAPLKTLVAADSDNVRIASLLAWQLAATKDPFQRDPASALEIATEACRATKYENPEAVDALAGAFAQNGRFREATRMAKEAIRLSKADRPELARAIEARLALYSAAKPFAK